MDNNGLNRVLVVDDDQVALEAIRDVFDEVDVQVRSYETPQDALDHLLEERPKYDLYIIDINFPGCPMNGFDLANEIMATDDVTPVMFISGGASAKQLARIRRLGHGYGYFEKGEDLAGLFDRCSALVSDRKLAIDVCETKNLVKALPGKLKESQEALCGIKSVKLEANMIQEMEHRIGKATDPSALVIKFSKNLFVVAIYGLILVMGGALFSWLLNTWEIANKNESELKVLKTTTTQIGNQMVEQRKDVKELDIKLDKILIKVNSGNNP
ncbi:MAG: hypothetical protein AMS21_00720 [Gemmatimonas sp. SG8_38_2]|nr:MAG: hypothetical protein AMS21_00720 [Gemmatimonas sp. SG8_38_2]